MKERQKEKERERKKETVKDISEAGDIGLLH